MVGSACEGEHQNLVEVRSLSGRQPTKSCMYEARAPCRLGIDGVAVQASVQDRVAKLAQVVAVGFENCPAQSQSQNLSKLSFFHWQHHLIRAGEPLIAQVLVLHYRTQSLNGD